MGSSGGGGNNYNISNPEIRSVVDNVEQQDKQGINNIQNIKQNIITDNTNSRDNCHNRYKLSEIKKSEYNLLTYTSQTPAYHENNNINKVQMPNSFPECMANSFRAAWGMNGMIIKPTNNPHHNGQFHLQIITES